MANNQENQTVTDGSQNAGQTVTANTGTDSTANSPITGPITAAKLDANSVTPQSIIANAVTTEKLAANSVDETENGPDWKALSRKHEKQAKDNYEQLRKTETAYEESQKQLHHARTVIATNSPAFSAITETARQDAISLLGESEFNALFDANGNLDREATEKAVATILESKPYMAAAPAAKSAEPATPVRDLAERVARMHGEGVPKIRSGSFADGYAAAKARQEQRRQARSAK